MEYKKADVDTAKRGDVDTKDVPKRPQSSSHSGTHRQKGRGWMGIRLG